MRFGPTALAQAEGAILAHAVAHGGGVFKKGRVLSASDVAALQAAGVAEVITARLDADDVPEDEAAHTLALALAGEGVRVQQAFTGRCNIHAAAAGVAVLDATRLSAINRLHESLTIATLAPFARVDARQMVATVKVIPFAVPRPVLAQALAIVAGAPLVRVAAFQPQQAGLVITRLPQSKSTLITKSETAMAERLSSLGTTLGKTVVVEHTAAAVAAAVAGLAGAGLSPVLVFGASAIVDRADVIPQGVEQAGGTVQHLGMPVDPGNLSMLATLGATPVVGVPSCARSPKVNGFDWILERLLAGLPVTRQDVMDMGVGGLLAEIPSRPSPREGSGALSAPRVAAVVLAAGLSRRMGRNKMLANLGGQPMIRATVQGLHGAAVDEVIVVTGHEAAQVEAALAGLDVRLVHNADFTSGLASSVRAGIAAAEGADAAIICLGDMPRVTAATLDRLIAAYNPTEHRSIVVPTHKGQFGNPVLWGREHFVRLMSLTGDRGARSLIDGLKADATEIAVDDDQVLQDADTPEALAALTSAAGSGS